MITASADSRDLVHRLKTRAAALAEERSSGVLRTLRRGPIDWRSPRALWPDILKGD
ncbi:MAG: hypothetical protein ACX930_12155 [Erythrobacter sp.]